MARYGFLDTFVGAIDCAEVQNHASPCPEARLLWAVVVRAILDAIRASSDVKGSHAMSAVDFLLSKSAEPVSFLWICDHLGLEADKIIKEVSRINQNRDRGAVVQKVLSQLAQAPLPLGAIRGRG